MQKQNYILIFIGAVLLYLVSTGISYFTFATFGGKRSSVTVADLPKTDEEGNFIVDESLPKTEVCPINGKLFTKPERAVWEKRRPMGVMIENSVDARPQSGLSRADVVYEAVAEGGITRFMGVFYCGIAENTAFAPVRSARTYFLDFISEYGPNPLYVHVGGANCSRDEGTKQCTTPAKAQALEQIQKYGWGGASGNDLNQFRLSFPICYRNPDRLGRPVATEHQMVCESAKLYDVANEDGWKFQDSDGVAWNEDYVSWKFADDAEPGNRGTVEQIEFGFWDRYSDFNVTWEYDADNNVYKRLNGGKQHIDLETDKQLTAKNVVVQFTDETETGDIHKHMLYDTIGSGDALIFQNGTVIDGSWSKASRTARTKFFNENGKELEFVRGEIWIEIVPTGNDVSY